MEPIGEVDKWLRGQYEEELQYAKMFRVALMERWQLYAAVINLMLQLERKEFVLDTSDFHASGKYVLFMKPVEENGKNSCEFVLQDNPNPELEPK
jgi:hypothetical protein